MRRIPERLTSPRQVSDRYFSIYPRDRKCRQVKRSSKWLIPSSFHKINTEILWQAIGYCRLERLKETSMLYMWCILWILGKLDLLLSFFFGTIATVSLRANSCGKWTFLGMVTTIHVMAAGRVYLKFMAHVRSAVFCLDSGWWNIEGAWKN